MCQVRQTHAVALLTAPRRPIVSLGTVDEKLRWNTVNYHGRLTMMGTVREGGSWGEERVSPLRGARGPLLATLSAWDYVRRGLTRWCPPKAEELNQKFPFRCSIRAILDVCGSLLYAITL